MGPSIVDWRCGGRSGLALPGASWRSAMRSPGVAVSPQLSRDQRLRVSQRARARVARSQLASGLQASEQDPKPQQQPAAAAPAPTPGAAAVGGRPPSAALHTQPLSVVLEGPMGQRRSLVLAPHDGLAVVLSEATHVGVAAHDAAVWLQPDGQDPVQLALVGRAATNRLVVGARALREAADFEPGTTLYVRPRGGEGHRPASVDACCSDAAEPQRQQRECRICSMGDDDDDQRDSPVTDPLIAPCGCKGTVQFVHISCLQEWRRRNMAQSRFCSVCGSGYNCIRDPSTWDYLTHHGAQLYHAPVSSVLVVFRGVYNHVLKERCSIHLSCLLTRVMCAVLLLFVAAALGRLLAAITSEVVHCLLVMDAMLDKLFLPDFLLDMMNVAFPPLTYVLSTAAPAVPAQPTDSSRPVLHTGLPSACSSSNAVAAAATSAPTADGVALGSTPPVDFATSQQQPELGVNANDAGEHHPLLSASISAIETMLRIVPSTDNDNDKVKDKDHKYYKDEDKIALPLNLENGMNEEAAMHNRHGGQWCIGAGAGAGVGLSTDILQLNLSLSLSWEDGVLGVLAWSVALSLVRTGGFGQGLRGLLLPLLQSPLALLGDFATLIHLLFPSVLAMVHGLSLLLPLCVYGARRFLHALGAVDLANPQLVVDFATGENLGVHIMLVLAAATLVANCFGLLHFVLRHSHEWRVRNAVFEAATV